MTHLFKLKKDGKTVGYLKIDPSSRFGVLWQKLDDVWIENIHCPDLYFKFDTAHLFVCPDKNGKDVFAGDEVKWKNPAGDEAEIEAVAKGGFLFWDVDGAVFCPADEVGDIELIEENPE